MKGEQLPLPVQLRESADFSNFFAGPNRAAVGALRALLDAPSAPGALLFGPPAAGKTHLLQAAAHQAQGQRGSAVVLALRGWAGAAPSSVAGAVDDWRRPTLLCLDDVDALTGAKDWALLLLRLLDARRAEGRFTLLAASAPAERLPCALPDLRSRLAAFATLGLRALDDEGRLGLLLHAAGRRGLLLADEAARWMLHHLPRDPASLLEALDLLDTASLRAQRRLTLPFVQQTLEAGRAA